MTSAAEWAPAVLLAVGVLVWPSRPAGWSWAPWHSARRGGRVSPAEEAGAAEVLDHVALALSGGVGLQTAIQHVAELTPGRAGAELGEVAAALAAGEDEGAAWASVPARWQSARVALQLASSAGVAPAALLRNTAADMRRDAAAHIDVQTARLSVHLVLPLGLAFLPAFVLITIVPVVIALATSLSATW